MGRGMKHLFRDFCRTRLAPSPTGMLHLGHVRTFMITWWMAQKCGAEVILRWDDLDTNRVRPDSISQLRSDLAWLGILPEREFFQSQRDAVYRRALERLERAGFVYPCTCSRQQVMLSAPHADENAGRYPGNCRGKYASMSQAGPGAYWRAKMPDRTIVAADYFAGEIRQNAQSAFGDIALTHADGKIGYQLSSIVDDGDMGVDCVIRGDDLLSSVPPQMVLADMLGIAAPSWCHVPLVVGQSGRRLAKRDGESRVAQFRRRGVKPEKIIGWAFWRSQNQKMPIECSMAEAVAEFDLTRVPREPVVLTAQDLAWLMDR